MGRFLQGSVSTLNKNNTTYQVKNQLLNIAGSVPDSGFFVVNNRPSADVLVADGSLADARSNRPVSCQLALNTALAVLPHCHKCQTNEWNVDVKGQTFCHRCQFILNSDGFNRHILCASLSVHYFYNPKGHIVPKPGYNTKNHTSTLSKHTAVGSCEGLQSTEVLNPGHYTKVDADGIRC